MTLTPRKFRWRVSIGQRGLGQNRMARPCLDKWLRRESNRAQLGNPGRIDRLSYREVKGGLDADPKAPVVAAPAWKDDKNKIRGIYNGPDFWANAYV
jgi:hypothetical protein